MTHVIHIYPNLGGFVWFCHTYKLVIGQLKNDTEQNDRLQNIL